MNWQSVWTVAAFFLGGLSSYIRDWVTEKRQRVRAEAERTAARQRAVLDRRESFELEHLQKLNEALQDLGRAAGRAHHLDTMTSKETGVYAGTQLTEDVSTGLLDANRAVHTLQGLVLNDELRGQVQQAHALLNVPSRMHQSSAADAEKAFRNGILALDAAQAAIATRIREIYIAREAGELNPINSSGAATMPVIPS